MLGTIDYSFSKSSALARGESFVQSYHAITTALSNLSAHYKKNQRSRNAHCVTGVVRLQIVMSQSTFMGNQRYKLGSGERQSPVQPASQKTLSWWTAKDLSNLLSVSNEATMLS
jgi:hypothetical protein